MNHKIELVLNIDAFITLRVLRVRKCGANQLEGGFAVRHVLVV